VGVGGGGGGERELREGAGTSPKGRRGGERVPPIGQDVFDGY